MARTGTRGSRRRKRRLGDVLGSVAVFAIIIGAVWWWSGQPDLFAPFSRASATHAVPSDPAGSSDAAAPAATSWTCEYLPTMDDDWHNDVLCVNGAQSERPQLLIDQDFVTEDDMRAAGGEYAASLNAGATP